MLAQKSATGAVVQTCAYMIIISESSAKAERPGSTRRFTTACRSSSAGHSNTPRHADAQRISVHTEEVRRFRSPAALYEGYPRMGGRGILPHRDVCWSEMHRR